MDRFESKPALVISAGGGIGCENAARFAGEGATVAVNDINAERAEATVQAI